MRETRGQEVKVGIFVAAGIGIFALFVFSLTLLGSSGVGDTYRVLFKNVAGLENGSLVRLGGLKVGRVERVGISKENLRMAEAVISVGRGTPIREDSRIQVTSVGVTGSMYLSISLGSPDSALVKPGSVMQGKEAASFQDTINEAQETASRMNKMLKGLDETARLVFGDVQGMVRSTRGKVSSILDTVDRTMARFENILSTKNEIVITRFLASLGRAADRLEKNIGPAVSGLQLTLGRVRQSIGRVERTAEAFRKLAGDSSMFIAQITTRLAAADRLLTRFDRVGEGLERVFASSEKAVAELSLALRAELQLIRSELQKEIAGAGTSIRREIGGVGAQAKAQLKKGGAGIEGALRAAKKEIEGAGTSLRREIGGVGAQARATLRKSGASLKKALLSVEKVAGRVDGFLVANQAGLKKIIDNFASLSKRLNTILLQISGGEEGERLRGAAEELRLALRRAHSLMSQLDDTVASHREDIQILITDLRETARNMSEFTATIKERPSSIILSAPLAPRTFGTR
jgi:phospholipid/cholesterol/gamma-HCH transport system substrate-binding protein